MTSFAFNISLALAVSLHRCALGAMSSAALMTLTDEDLTYWMGEGQDECEARGSQAAQVEEMEEAQVCPARRRRIPSVLPSERAVQFQDDLLAAAYAYERFEEWLIQARTHTLRCAATLQI